MRAGLILALVSALVACRAGPYPVTRVMGGERRAGVFVSPYAYEHFVRAELAAAHGDDELAVNEYRLARAGSVDDAYVIARLAGALMRLLRLEEADAALAEGDVVDPESEAIAVARGDLYRMRSDDEAAVASYVRAAELAPSSDTPIFRLAALLESTGAAGRALEALASGSSPARLRAALAIAVARRDAASAGRIAERLSRIAPVYAADIAEAAQLALTEGRPILALHLLRHPLLGENRLLPLRARALLAAGRSEEAEVLVVGSSDRAIPEATERASLLLAVGRADLALEIAELAAGAGDERARVWVAASALELLDAPRAAEVAARIPAAASDGARATQILDDALRTSGLPELAVEVHAAREATALAASRLQALERAEEEEPQESDEPVAEDDVEAPPPD